jgi:hypothetical protein
MVARSMEVILTNYRCFTRIEQVLFNHPIPRMRLLYFKSEIVQPGLSDLGCDKYACMHHAIA